VLSVIAQ
jgi:dynein heavy chain